MMTFKCKMCGGDLSFEPGASVAECPYCGTLQTLPKLDDDKRANLYDRANHFRRQNEYDKAMAIYEQILAEDRADAEAYWSLVLCRYGIEYVEDPATRKRVPTVNRVQYASILADEDYKAALQYADAAQRSVYEAEAAAIAEIQKGILDISKQEQPFDVFICYKETDANGRRTPDSVLANDMYHQLTKEGFKVFFSRITLEDKIGTAYEPYIFAALNSAKVMVVLGTKPEYFNAVWVKNEWSRYLALIRAGADKTLVPAYRDMDPYDLPEEFAHLQAQDMGKLGFMQDLIRGIKKLTAKDEPKAQHVIQQVVPGGSANIENLMKRAQLFMEDGDWNSANEYLNKVLDENAEYAPAYVGKVQAAMKLRKEAELASCLTVYEYSSDWQKALRFATAEQKKTYAGYVEGAKATREEKRKSDIYDSAIQAFNAATTLEACDQAKARFESISGYRDADEKAAACHDKGEQFKYQAADQRATTLSKAANNRETVSQWEQLAETFNGIGWGNAKKRAEQCCASAEAVRSAIYKDAAHILESAKEPGDCDRAKRRFSELGNYSDAQAQMDACERKKATIQADIDAKKEAERRRAEEERRQAEAREKAEAAKRRTRAIIICLLLAAIVAGAFVYVNVIKPNGIYNSAVAALNAGKYDEEANLFESLGDYKDATAQLNMTYYAQGEALRETKDFEGAVVAFEKAGDYSDAAMQLNSTYYLQGEALRETKDFEGAVAAFKKAGDYSDAVTQISATYYAQGEVLQSQGKSFKALFAYRRAGKNYNDSAEKIAVLEEMLSETAMRIAAGDRHTIGLKSDGTVVAVGDNYHGQCDVGNWKLWD